MQNQWCRHFASRSRRSGCAVDAEAEEATKSSSPTCDSSPSMGGPPTLHPHWHRRTALHTSWDCAPFLLPRARTRPVSSCAPLPSFRAMEAVYQLYGAGAPLASAVSSLRASTLSSPRASVQAELIRRASGRAGGHRGHSLLIAPDVRHDFSSDGGGGGSGNSPDAFSPHARNPLAADSGGAHAAALDTLTLISDLGRSDFISVSAKEQHALLLSSSGDVYSWVLRSGTAVAGGLGGSRQGVASTPQPESQPRQTIDSDSQPRAAAAQTGPAPSAARAVGLLLNATLVWERALRGVRVCSVACGSRHCVVLTAAPSAEVWTWGAGADGRLGHGTESDELVPRVVVGLLNFRVSAVSAGSAHTAAITMGSKEWTLIEAVEIAAFERLAMASRTDHEAVAAAQRTAATSILKRHRRVREGERALGVVWTWGKGANGRLGHGSIENVAAPKRVRGVVRLAHRALTRSGGDGTAVLTASAAAPTNTFIPRWFPGLGLRSAAPSMSSTNQPRDAYELLRVGIPSTPSASKRGVSPLDAAGITAQTDVRWRGGVLTERPIAIAIDCGRAFTIALTADGDVWTWGAQNACGVNAEALRREYASIAGARAIPPVTSLSVNGDSLRPHRVVFGEPHYAPPCASAEAAARLVFSRIASPLLRLLVCPHGFATTASDTAAMSAPANDSSELTGSIGGEKTSGAASVPSRPRVDSEGVARSVAYSDAGDASSTVDVTQGLDAVVWAGGGIDGGVDSVRVASISAGYAHALVSTRDGEVWAWGLNATEQVGAGRMNDVVRTPVQLPLHLHTHVAAEQHAAAAVAGLGAAQSMLWVPFSSSASAASYFDPIVSVYAGPTSSVAVTARGIVMAWGDNSEGSCGVASADAVVGPQPVYVARDSLSAACVPEYVATFGTMPFASPRNTIAASFAHAAVESGANNNAGSLGEKIAGETDESAEGTSSLDDTAEMDDNGEDSRAVRRRAASAAKALIRGGARSRGGSRHSNSARRITSVAFANGIMLVVASNQNAQPPQRSVAVPEPFPLKSVDATTDATSVDSSRARPRSLSGVVPAAAAAAMFRTASAAAAARIEEENQRLKLSSEWEAVLGTIAGSWDHFQATDANLAALWKQGVPPSIRARVWSLAIGNALRLTPSLFELLQTRAAAIRAELSATARATGGGGGDTTAAPRSPLPGRLAVSAGIAHGREASLALIPLDLLRTFPQLRLFGPPGSDSAGPLHSVVREALEAVTLLRPDIGYVQGMSYVAALISIFTLGAGVSAALARPRMGGFGSRGLSPRGGVYSPSARGLSNTDDVSATPVSDAALPSAGLRVARFTLASAPPLTPGSVRFGNMAGTPTVSSAPLPLSPLSIASSASFRAPLNRAASALLPLASGQSAHDLFGPDSSRTRTDSDVFSGDATARTHASPGSFSDSASTATAASASNTPVSPQAAQSLNRNVSLDSPTSVDEDAFPSGPLLVSDSRFVTFQLLANVFSRHHFVVFFAMDPGPLAPYYDVFDRLLETRLPALSAHLTSAGVQCEMYVFGWFQTVFLKALPLSTAVRVWDAFLLEGTPALFRAALALMGIFEPLILRADFFSFENTVQLLTAGTGARGPAGRVWDSIEATAFARAMDTVQIPADALIDIEDVAGDCFFYRRVVI